MKNARILSLGLSLAIALSASAVGAVTSIGTNISTGGTLTVTGTSTLGMINSGTWNGTAIGVANGGTGATDAAGARTNLGLTIGTDVQAFSQGLLDIAGIAHASSSFVVSDGASWIGIDGAGARSSLGLVIGTDVQAYDATLAAIAGGTWTGATSITDLGTITTGTWNGTSIDDANIDDNITVSGYLPLAGGVLGGAIDMDGYAITMNGGTINGAGALFTGSVGIGTTTPDRSLVVEGNVLITGTLDAGSITFSGADISNVGNMGVTGQFTMQSANQIAMGPGTSFRLWDDNTASHIATNDDSNRDLVIQTGANVVLSDGGLTVFGSINGLNFATSSDGFTLDGGDVSRTLSITGGNITFTGDAGGTSSLTLPATGVLATLDGTEVFTNKSLTSPAITGAPTATGATWDDLGTVTTIDIDGGTIDGTTIGATTPADATFATGTFSGLVAPSGTSPSSGDACSVTGSISIDTDAASGSRIIWCDGALWQDN